ncbi:MAG: EF-P beta-lysylation protein EpmB, partial [Porticoccaceae bacterium]|nr:EF-P beta-lysylation protein EpmB [Porticoccaceae bacterium]
MLKPLNLPINAQTASHSHWQTDLSQCITSLSELLAELEIDTAQLTSCQRATAQFALRVPRPFVERMRKGDPNDPLLTQVLPVSAEMQLDPAYSPDPLDESSHNPIAGIVHKYRHRLLLIVSPACAINCRYCFRKNYPYSGNVGQVAIAAALGEIADDSSISEVILSGGDPLFLNDVQLSSVFSQLAEIKHVKRLRIHTRLPVVFPERLTQKFVSTLSGLPYLLCVVIHANHPNELDDEVLKKLSNCKRAGITLLNQSVLLKGINDSPQILAKLSERLFEGGVLPYYVHLLDKVSGAEHFDVSLKEALMIEQKLRQIL